MDTRQPLQLTPEPSVLSINFNDTGTRLTCGLDNGVRMFRSKDCIRTLKESPQPGRGYGLAAALDDRHVFLVGGGRQPNASPNVLQCWNNQHAALGLSLDFAEPILGLRATAKVLAVVLVERTVFFRYRTHDSTADVVPGLIEAIHDTAPNNYALCCVRGDKSVLPGVTSGQVQILGLADKTKKIIRAHASDLRGMDLSADGEILATASKQGTLIRVFSTTTLTQTHEFRRGVDAATIYSLAISPRSQLIACTSDKGTLHIFDLRPAQPDEAATRPPSSAAPKRPSAVRIPSHTRRPGSTDFDAMSMPSQAASSRPISSAGFHGAPPSDIVHTPPGNAPSALSALAKLPGMPRAFSDARSLTAAPYHLGSDPPNWQGQPAYLATTLPNGSRGKVKNANTPVPGLPDGRPPKGILCWDQGSGDRRIWCVGGGADARWEVFELLESDTGRLRLVKAGYRLYLRRQFPESGN